MEQNAPQWIKTDWKKSDLQDKTVEFRITLDGWRIHDRGTFDVMENTEGMKRIDIVVRRGFEGNTTRYYLPQEAEPKIKPSASGTGCDFTVFLTKDRLP